MTTTRELVIRFDVQQGMESHGIAIDATWVADAELVIVRVSPAGSVERDLYIEDFLVDLPSRSTSSSSR